MSARSVPSLPADQHDDPARTPEHSVADQRVSMCLWELNTEAGPTGPIAVLRVAGEIDLLTLPVLRHALTTALDQRHTDVVVDLAAVGFCCVRGFAELAAAATAADADRTGFALSGLPPHLNRIATLLRPDRHLVRYRSAAAAVTAIRIDQTYRPV